MYMFLCYTMVEPVHWTKQVRLIRCYQTARLFSQMQYNPLEPTQYTQCLPWPWMNVGQSPWLFWSLSDNESSGQIKSQKQSHFGNSREKREKERRVFLDQYYFCWCQCSLPLACVMGTLSQEDFVGIDQLALYYHYGPASKIHCNYFAHPILLRKKSKSSMKWCNIWNLV